MAIKGLSDRGMAFPQIGRIRKGIKLKQNMPDGSTRELPQDLDYFRVEFAEGEESAASEFTNIYGDQPDEINVLLPLRMEDTWDAWLEAYARGRMVAKSDGEKFIYMRDQNMNVTVRNGEDADGEEVPYLGERGREQAVCGSMLKPVGRLKVVIPELMRRAYLELKTTSYHDVDNLSRQIRSIYGIEELMGGIPLVLRRKPHMITVPGKGGSSFRKKMYLISIEPKQEWVKWKQLADANHVMENMGLGMGSKPGLQLDGGVIEGEFTNVNADGDEIHDAKEVGEMRPE